MLGTWKLEVQEGRMRPSSPLIILTRSLLACIELVILGCALVGSRSPPPARHSPRVLVDDLVPACHPLVDVRGASSGFATSLAPGFSAAVILAWRVERGQPDVERLTVGCRHGGEGEVGEEHAQVGWGEAP
jgi:hypothetical protein